MSQDAGSLDLATLLEKEGQPGNFSLSEARRIVGDLFTPKPWVYWVDFLLCWSVGVAAFELVASPQLIVADLAWHWPVRVVCFVVSSLLFYRCTSFIHELMHLHVKKFKGFRFIWNMLCGIPFLIPSFVYYRHNDHHRRNHFGTEHDGEYVALTRMPAWKIAFHMSRVLIVPILGVVRFGLLTPLTWVSSSVRDWVHGHASSMIMDARHIRPLPTKRTLQNIRMQEFFCFLWILFIAVRLTTSFGILFDETLPITFLLQAYLTGVFILTVNGFRNLGSHRWTNNGSETTFVEQMLDSVDYPKNPLVGEMWAPVGLRFHALHHLFPTIPYHALPTAHHRLILNLPSDSLYRRCSADSLTEVLGTLWHRARTSEQAEGHSSKSANAAI